MSQKSVGIVVKPPLRRSSRKTAEYLDKTDCEALFLNLPQNMDELVTALQNGLDYEQFLTEIEKRKLLPTPIRAWIGDLEPILESLRPDIATYCYKDTANFQESSRRAISFTQMVLRATITHSVDTEKWDRLLREEIERSRQALEIEAQAIRDEALNYDKSICIAGFDAHGIQETLRKDLETWLHYIDNPYHFTPLEILRRELAIGKISPARIAELVSHHIDFVRNYVLPSNIEEGYLKWMKNKARWLIKNYQKNRYQ